MAVRRSKRQERSNARPLNREKIAMTAIDIVRADGQAKLSMRKVAVGLGVDVAALYRHFENKEALLIEVGRLAAEAAVLELPSEGKLEDRFFELCRAIYTRIVEHPELGLYGGGSPWARPFIGRANGLLATLLSEAGLRGTDLVFSTQLILHLVTSAAQSEVLAKATPEANNKIFARTILEHLPEELRESWPRVTKATDWSISFEEFFEYSIRAILDGVRAKAKKKRTRA